MPRITITSPGYDAAIAKMNADGSLQRALDDLKRGMKPYDPAELVKIGARIGSLPELMAAAGDKRAVICPTTRTWSRPRPAAFMIGLPARDVFDLITQGLFIYEKPKKMYRGWNVAQPRTR